MKEFSPMTCASLHHYVYELIDPRDNSVFYVGEGVNNRVFSHEIEARDNPEVQKAKVERINEIKAENLSVRKLIVHSGMDAITAFECECTLIDGLISAGVKLTNAIGGHHSSMMDVYEAESRYGASILYSDDYKRLRFLVLNVTSPIVDGDESWRKNWKLDEKMLKKVDFVCFRHKKVIRKVFMLHHNMYDWNIRVDKKGKKIHDFAGNDEDQYSVLRNKIIYENPEQEKVASQTGGEQWSRKYYNVKNKK